MGKELFLENLQPACNNTLLAIFSVMDPGLGFENLVNNLLISLSDNKVSFSSGRKLVREVLGLSLGNFGRDMAIGDKQLKQTPI